MGSNGTARQVQILLVEDDEAIREAISDILEDACYAVRCAEHGARALDLLARGPVPDLILMDLMMPVMDGWELTNQLARSERWRDIPVISISAARDPAPRHACFALRKPLDIDALLGAVERCRRAPVKSSLSRSGRRPPHSRASAP